MPPKKTVKATRETKSAPEKVEKKTTKKEPQKKAGAGKEKPKPSVKAMKVAKVRVMKQTKSVKQDEDIIMTTAPKAPETKNAHEMPLPQDVKIPDLKKNKLDDKGEGMLNTTPAASHLQDNNIGHGDLVMEMRKVIQDEFAFIRKQMAEDREEMFAFIREQMAPIREQMTQMTHMQKSAEELREKVERIGQDVMDVKKIAQSRRQETQAKRPDARKKDEDKSTGPPNLPQPSPSAFHMTPENKNTKSMVPKLFVTPPAPTPAAINDLYGLPNGPQSQEQTPSNMNAMTTPIRSQRKHLNTPGTSNSAISAFTPIHRGGEASPSATTPVTLQDLNQWAKKSRVRKSPLAQMARGGAMYATKECAMKALGNDTTAKTG